MDIVNRKQAARYVNDRIPSPALKEFIFGSEQPSHKDIDIGSINRVLTTEFLLIYLKWLKASRNELRRYTSKHFSRAQDVMMALYKGQKFDLDAIVYVLTEGQKDICENGDSSFFAPFMDVAEKCEFGKIYGLIDEWKINPQTSVSIETISHHFFTAVSVSKALTKTDLIRSQQGDTLITDFSLNGEILKTWEIVYVDKTGVRYVLVDKGYEKEDALLHYMAIDDMSRITIIKKANRS